MTQSFWGRRIGHFSMSRKSRSRSRTVAFSILSILALTVAPIVGLTTPAQAIIPVPSLPLPLPLPLPFGHFYVVNTTVEGSGTGACATGGSCSFVQAVNAYDADTLTVGYDTIEFSPSLPNPANFLITSPVVIDNPSGISLHINGSGASGTVITGGLSENQTYIEINQRALVSMSNLTVEDMHYSSYWQINIIDSVVALNDVSVLCTGSVDACESAQTGGIQIVGGAVTGNSLVVAYNRLAPGDGGGGGIEIQMGGFVLTNSTVASNTAASGGGVYNDAGRLYLLDSDVVGNTAIAYGGGGVMNVSGSVLTAGGLIQSNVAAVDGGGIANVIAAGPGSPHALLDCSGTFINANSAGTNGGGVYDDSPLDLLIQVSCPVFANTPNNIYTA